MAGKYLDCEVYRRGKRSANTSKQREAIKNSELLGFDLLVREMLQNSVDAALDEDTRKTISVYFNDTDLDVDAFAEMLGRDSARGVDYAKLLRAYVRDNDCCSRCLSIRDVGCVGMDGDVEDQESRAWKLPFGFLDGQDYASVSGGANGVGKVVAFKFGIGFVAYYSRTKDGKSRFVIAFMDDGVREVFPRSVLPEGAAWWGVRHSSSEVFCLEDAAAIADMLKAFGLKPYPSGRSGTTVIIPFFDFEEVVREAQSMFPVSICPWVSTFDSYLRFCARQWYAPRMRIDVMALDPESLGGAAPYHWGRGLKVCQKSIADKSASESKVFGLIRELYDIAVGDAEVPSDVMRVQCPLHRGGAKKGVEFSGEGIGWVAVKKISYLKGRYKGILPVLCALAPGRHDEETGIDFTNRVSGRRGFMLYCRQHGMVISYEREWDDMCYGLLPKPQDGEFYVGIFVVDSQSRVKSRAIKTPTHEASVDVMFRTFENTDHYRWPRNATYEGVPVMNHLLYNIKQKLGDSCKANEAVVEREPLDRLSALLGRFMSPVGDGFGDGPRLSPEGVGGVPDGLLPGGKKSVSSSSGGGSSGGSGGSGGRIGDGSVVKVGRAKFSQGAPKYSMMRGATVVTIPMAVEFSARNQKLEIICGVVQDGSSRILRPGDFSTGDCPISIKGYRVVPEEGVEPPETVKDDEELVLTLKSSQKGRVEVECMYALSRRDSAIAVECRVPSGRDEGGGE